MNQKKESSFFQNLHDFDRDGPGVRKKAPPKEFTAQDLEAVRQEGYSEGKKDGFQESQDSIMRQVLALMQNIRQHSNLLFAAEDERQELYETEAVHLTASIYGKTFPLFSELYGLEDMKAVIRKVVSDNKAAKKITVRVSPALFEPSQKFFQEQGLTSDGVELESCPSLSGTQCNMEWKGGGVSYDPQKIAVNIFSILEETLAMRDISVHDKLELRLEDPPEDDDKTVKSSEGEDLSGDDSASDDTDDLPREDEAAEENKNKGSAESPDVGHDEGIKDGDDE